MNTKIPGIFIPPAMMTRLESAKDAKRECVAIATEIIKEVRPLAQGVHLMAIGWEDLLPEIISSIVHE